MTTASVSSVGGTSVGLRPGQWTPEEESREWSCGVCTFLNKPLFLACDMCGTARPTEKPTLGNSGSPSCSRLEDEVVDSPRISAPERNCRHSHHPSSCSDSISTHRSNHERPQKGLECPEDQLYRAGFQPPLEQVVTNQGGRSRSLMINSHHGLNIHAPIIMREDPNDYPSQDATKKEESDDEEELDESYQRRYRPTSARDDPTMDESMDRSMERHLLETPHQSNTLRNLERRNHHMRRRTAEDDYYQNSQNLDSSYRSMNDHSRRSMNDLSRRSMNASYNNRSFNASNVPIGLRKQPPPNSLSSSQSNLMNSHSTATTEHNSTSSHYINNNSYQNNSLTSLDQSSYSHLNASRGSTSNNNHGSLQGQPRLLCTSTQAEIAWHHRRSDGLPVLDRQESAASISTVALQQIASAQGPPPRARPHMSLSFRAPPPGERPQMRRTASSYVAHTSAPLAPGGNFVEEVLPSIVPPPIPSNLKKDVDASGKSQGDDDDNDDDVLLMMENPGNVDVMRVLARDQQQKREMQARCNSASSGRSKAAPITNSKDRASMLNNLSNNNPLIGNNATSSRSSRLLSGNDLNKSQMGFEEHRRPFGSSDSVPQQPSESHQGKTKMKGTVRGLMAAMRISKKG